MLKVLQTDLRADVSVEDERFSCGDYVLPFEARLLGPGQEPLRFEWRGERLLWVPPAALGLDGPCDMTDALHETAARLSMRSMADGSEFPLPARHELVLRPDGELVTPVLRGEARIETGRAAGGWELVADLNVFGLAAVGKLRTPRGHARYAVELDARGAVVGRYRGTPLASLKRRRRTSGAAI